MSLIRKHEYKHKIFCAVFNVLKWKINIHLMKKSEIFSCQVSTLRSKFHFVNQISFSHKCSRNMNLLQNHFNFRSRDFNNSFFFCDKLLRKF